MMNNPYIRFFVIIIFVLFIGIVIGYSINNSDNSSANTNIISDEQVEPNIDVVNNNDNNDNIFSSRQTAITKAVAKASPAVVGINVITVRQVRVRDPFFDDPFFRHFFGDRIYNQEVKELGSGFIISPDGYIVTNDHVAGNGTKITVTLSGGKQMEAKIIGTDQATDICLLKVDGKDLPYLKMGNSDEVIIGEWAIALGNPFGLFEYNAKPTVTVGVISATDMTFKQPMEGRYYRKMIETDAAINGGNSGGPLVNSNGEVIGMNTLIFTGGQTNTFIGYGFAIPINKIKKIISALKKDGTVLHNITAGFDVQPVDDRIARYFGMKQAEGVIVSDINNNGPADKAGILIGDIILEVNGEKVNSYNDILSVMTDLKAGDVLNFKIFRDRKIFQIQLKLSEIKR